MYVFLVLVLLGAGQTLGNAQPKVEILTEISTVETKLLLKCFATGFYPKDIVLHIKRDGYILTEQDGLRSSEVQLNGDGTFQSNVSVEIFSPNCVTYECEVIHEASNVHVIKTWENKCADVDSCCSSACRNHLSKIAHLLFVDAHLEAHPKVEILTEISTVETKFLLTCFATGFYKQDIVLNIKRGWRVLTKEDGLRSSGVLPNGDGTFRRNVSVEISKPDCVEYECEVIHDTLKVCVIKTWGICYHLVTPDPVIDPVSVPNAWLAVPVLPIIAAVALTWCVVRRKMLKAHTLSSVKHSSSNRSMDIVLNFASDNDPTTKPLSQCPSEPSAADSCL